MKLFSRPTVVVADCLQYLPIMLIANAAGCAGLLAAQIFITILLNNDRSYTRGAAGYIIVFLMAIAAFAVSLTVTYILCRRKFDNLFAADIPLPTVHANTLALVLPAEILRFLIASLPWKPGGILGLRFFDGLFTVIPSFLFDQLYLVRHGGVRRVREEGYLPGDNAAYIAIYLVYFLLLCIAFVGITRLLHRRLEAERRAKEIKYAEDAGKSAHEYVRLRDYFYSSAITRADRLRYAALTFGVHFGVYLIVSPLLSAFLTIYTGDSATNILLQMLLGIPLAAILPFVFMKRLARPLIRSIFSLADEEKDIPQKLFALCAPGEAIRFALGLILFMGYGAYVAPLPAMVFSAIFNLLTGGFDTGAAPTAPALIHWLLFLLLYLLYFAVFEILLSRRLCRMAAKHRQYLVSVQAEKDKYQNYYHR